MGKQNRNTKHNKNPNYSGIIKTNERNIKVLKKMKGSSNDSNPDRVVKPTTPKQRGNNLKKFMKQKVVDKNHQSQRGNKTAREFIKGAKVGAKFRMPASLLPPKPALATALALGGEVEMVEGGHDMEDSQSEETSLRRTAAVAMRARADLDLAAWEAREAGREARGGYTGSHMDYGLVREVVAKCDVVLEVLDAREPLGTRSTALEGMVRACKNKRLVFVLNKADLVPKANLEAWKTYLKHEAPVVTFKAASQRKNKLVKGIRVVHNGENTVGTPSAMGCQALTELLKNYGRSDSTAALTVGVVGLPNVGKSSLINSLKRSKACEVSATPGSTRSLREVKLDTRLFLVDSPGVLFPSSRLDPVEAVLRNVVGLTAVEDLAAVGSEIWRRLDRETLCSYYDVPGVCETFEEFILSLARRLNSMKVSGVVDTDEACKKVIYDWQHGFLLYYNTPPVRSVAESSIQLRETAVSTEDEEMS